MRHEFLPTDAPYPADADVQFGAPPEQVTTELLELCEQFLRQASPIVHTELSDFLTEMVTALAVSVRSSTPWASPPF